MKIFQLAAAAVIANSPLPTVVTAQTQDPITCSCTPNSYSFSLNFDGTCPGSTEGSGGIDGSICFFVEGGDSANIDAGMIAGISVPPTRRRRLGNAAVEKSEEWVDTVLSKVDFTTHTQHAADVHATRQLQLDTTPIIITSVTFLELDTTPQLNVINQDSTYFETSLSDGEVITYPSISAQLDVNKSLDEQLDLVPGGVQLILFGTNAAGEVIQNRLAWGYKRNYCNEEPLAVGNQIGWQSLDGYTSAFPEFCNAVTASPTPAPVVSPPQPTLPPATTDGPTFSKSSKSKTEKATTKSSKAEKMSMPSSAKSKKGELVDLTSNTDTTAALSEGEEEDV